MDYEEFCWYLHEAFSFSPQVFAPHRVVYVCVCACMHACVRVCAISTFSSVGSLSSNHLRMCMYLCVHIYRHSTEWTAMWICQCSAYHTHTHTHTHTHSHTIWAPTGLKVDTAVSVSACNCTQNTFQIQLWTILINLLHLQFWHNDRGLSCATVVRRGWNAYRNKSQHAELALENNRKFCRGSNPWLFAHEFGSLPVPLMFRCKSSRKLA